MKTKITQNPNIISFKRFANNIVTKKKAMSLFLILFSLFIIPKSLNAWEIAMVKAPNDGIELMKKYSIVRAVDDDGYVIAGSTISTHFQGEMSVNVIKINDNGNIDWSYYYNKMGSTFEATHIDYNIDSNGYVISGHTSAQPGFISADHRPFIIEIDDQGVMLRNAIVLIRGLFFKVKPTPKGSYIAVGIMGDTSLIGMSTMKKGICVKFNNLLNLQWMYGYSGKAVSVTPPSRLFDGIQAVHVVYDGVNETYVLGGNSTGTMDIETPPFSSTFNEFDIPVINLHELNENGGVMYQKTILPYGIRGSSPNEYNQFGRDMFVQDIVVVEDPQSPYYQDVFVLGQEITMNNYNSTSGTHYPNDGYYLTLARFKRTPFVLDSDFIPLEGATCEYAHHYCRGNNLTFLNEHLYIFGTMETSGLGTIQIPFVAKIPENLPTVKVSDPCDPRPYPCIMFRDASLNGEAYFHGYRDQFPDFLGTTHPHPNNATMGIQFYGQSLGYADLNGGGDFRYGIVSNKKPNSSATTWSLYVVSNIDDYYCEGVPDYLIYEGSYDHYIDTFRSTSDFGPPADTGITLTDQVADFMEFVCGSYDEGLDFPPMYVIDDGITFNNMSNKIISEDERVVSFYPNPASEEINFKGIIEGDILKIRDINGKLIREITISNSVVNLSQLISGVYIIQISRNQELIFTGKLIK